MRKIIAHVFMSRGRKIFNLLFNRLSIFNVAFWYTDDFNVYNILPKKKHIVGKLYIQHIERETLTTRTQLKRLNQKRLDTQNQQQCTTK